MMLCPAQLRARKRGACRGGGERHFRAAGAFTMVRLAARWLIVLAAAAAQGSSANDEPLLFMDTADVSLSWGLIEARPNAVQPAPSSFRPPPGDYTKGDTVIAVLEAQSSPGTWEVYLEHANGTEPLATGAGSRGRATEQNGHVALLRFTTTDFVHYTPAQQVLYIESGGTPTLKSIARDDSGLYVMFSTLAKSGDHSFLSRDQGRSWSIANCTTGCVVHPDKDDLNLIFNKGRFVDMQIVWQQDITFVRI